MSDGGILDLKSLSRLKSELSWLRRKGAIKVGVEEGGVAPRSCGRCQTELGLIFNRGAPCPSCKQRVCKDCRKHGPLGKDWVCVVCSKQIEIQLATGEWMNEFIRRPSRRKEKGLLSAAEGLRKTLLRRSWSISSPTASSCDLSPQEGVVKRRPPKKPPRKSLCIDDNEPVREAAPLRPLRRYSMTSFDVRRSLRGTLGYGTGTAHQEASMPSDDSCRRPSPRSLSTHHLSPSEPPKYFFGNDPFQNCPRPSTLPRRPSQRERPLSFGDFETDSSNRFHSIPRSKNQRSPTRIRGRSEPHPIPNDTSISKTYLSSGPVTSTPINSMSHNGLSFPTLQQDDPNRSTSAVSESLKKASRAFNALSRKGSLKEESLARKDPVEGPLHEENKDSVGIHFRNPKENFIEDRVIHRRKSDGFAIHLRKDSHGGGPQGYRKDSDGGGPKGYRKDLGILETTPRRDLFNERPPTHHKSPDECGISLRKGPTYGMAKKPEDKRFAPYSKRISSSQELMSSYHESPGEEFHSLDQSSTERNGFLSPLKTPGPHIPRSNTSVTSRFGLKARPKRASSAPVRRSKSLQARNSGGDVLVEELSRRKISGSQVAKFVQQLEMGIQETMENMNPRKNFPLDNWDSSLDAVASTPPQSFPFISRSITQEDDSRTPHQEDNIRERLASKLDISKVPSLERNDYKIVFVSSDSPTTESDVSSSLDLETPSSSGLVGLSKSSSIQRFSGQLNKNWNSMKSLKFADASVMTGNRGCSSENNSSLPTSDDSYLSYKTTGVDVEVSGDGKAKISAGYQWPPRKRSFGDSSNTTASLVPPLTTLNPDEFQLMLQQTEVVQAEAQALQKALMGAFDLSPVPLMSVAKNHPPKGEQSRNSKTPPIKPTHICSKVSNEQPNYHSKKEMTNDFATLSPLKKASPHSYLEEAPKKEQTEYENIQLHKQGPDEENTYENVNFRSDIIKPITVCKSVSIQTEPEILSGDEETYETSDYSDVSFDSHRVDIKRQPTSNPKMPHHLCPVKPHLFSQPTFLRSRDEYNSSPENNNTNNNKDNKDQPIGTKGEESFTPPFSYLPAQSPSTNLSLPRAVHLSLASDRDFSSVSRSSECEPVRESVRGNRGQPGGVFKLPKSDKNASQTVPYNPVNALSKWRINLRSVYDTGVCGDPPVTQLEALKATGDKGSTPPKRSLDLATANDNSPHPPSLKTGQTRENNFPRPFRKMSAKEVIDTTTVSSTPPAKEDSDDEESHREETGESNVNASKEVISRKEFQNEEEASFIPVDSDDAVPDEGNSSGTSEGEDTDDDTHVSRSYDVAKPSKIGSDDEDTISNQDGSHMTSPSFSGSDTDEENTFNKKYDVTQASSSEPESENGKENALIVLGETKEINHVEENAQLMGSNEKTKATNIVEKIENNPIKTTPSNTIDQKVYETEIKCDIQKEAEILKNISSSESHRLNTEGLEISSETPADLRVKNKVSILNNVEKTDLPECDQGLKDDNEMNCSVKVNSNASKINEPPVSDLLHNDCEQLGYKNKPFSSIEDDSESLVATEDNLVEDAEKMKVFTLQTGTESTNPQFSDATQLPQSSQQIKVSKELVSTESTSEELENKKDEKIVITNNETDIKTSECNLEVFADKRDSLSDKDKDETAEQSQASQDASEGEREDLKAKLAASLKTIDECNFNKDEVINLTPESAIKNNSPEIVKDIATKEENKITLEEESTMSKGNQITLEQKIKINEGEQENKSECINVVKSDNEDSFNHKGDLKRESGDENAAHLLLENLESQAGSEASKTTVPTIAPNAEEGLKETSSSESDDLKRTSESNDRKLSSGSNGEFTPTQITGSVEVEQLLQRGYVRERATVSHNALSDSHEKTPPSDTSEICYTTEVGKENFANCERSEVIANLSGKYESQDKIDKLGEKDICSSGESGHSSGGESEEVEVKDSPKNILKINVAENEETSNEANNKGERSLFGAMGATGKGVKKESVSSQVFFPGLLSTKFSKSFTPPIPLRKAKRSSSSDGLSSSSDIERSDPDASDSADTVIEGNRLRNKTHGYSFKQSHISDEVNRDSDGPSSADSLLQGADSESQCSEGSEEGNLISIVAVGEDTIPKPTSQGKIYIRSDLTDSDVQIKPTCIVVTGSSGAESDDEGANEDNSIKTDGEEGNDVTILEVTSDHYREHVMSVRVTSPESSRSASPARKSNVSELQSMILTSRERQQQFRRPNELKESSSLTNYFTVTLGTDSPAAPRRLNKTPEVRRRKIPERESCDLPSGAGPTKTTATPSPSHTPSPPFIHTPDHAEGELPMHEDPASLSEELSDQHHSLEGDSLCDWVYNEYDDHYDSYNDLEVVHEEEGAFDSIDDEESFDESSYDDTSSTDGFEREEKLRGYCKKACDYSLPTIIEESCEESDYDRRGQEDDSIKRDPSELEKYFWFGLGNGPAESKKYANEESEYSDTFSETSSSIYSEGMESLDCEEVDPAELAFSRLEKYFSGFSGFERHPSIRSVGEDSELLTDESGSVGSDSEGSLSPEKPRKKLFKSRGVRSVSSNRPHGYSSDKGEGIPSDGSHQSDGDEKTLASGEDEISTESDETAFDKGDGQFDTIKRRKKKKILAELSEKKMETTLESKEESLFIKKSDMNKRNPNNDGEQIHKKSAEDDLSGSKDKSIDLSDGDLTGSRYQSRDSGFIGSSDDLLRDKSEDSCSKEPDTREKQPLAPRSEESMSVRPREKTETIGEGCSKAKTKGNQDESNNTEDHNSNKGKVSRSSTGSSVDLTPFSHLKGSHNLTRKDSFNNWSSDEETNIMMNRMRIFFKNMFSNVPRDMQNGQRVKSPQLAMFEAKLTNLMRTVPGINDEQVKEIVEYLSSEDTWSDSYDSSDYTSSDLENAYALLDRADPELKSEIQEQISASCQQIIKKFDQSREASDTDSANSLFGGQATSESSEASSKDTAFVYQRFLNSMSHVKADSDRGSVGSGSQSTSPSFLVKVMPYIRDRLVALMHEVSAGSENGDDVDSFNGGATSTPSPRPKLFLPKNHNLLDNNSRDSSIDKSSITSTSFESEDSPTDTEQSPESETGTPKIFRCQKLSIINERSSTEDFNSYESQRTVFSSHGSPRHHLRLEPSKLSHPTLSQRSLDDRSGVASSILPPGRGKEEDRPGVREHIGLLKASRKGGRPEARKAKSHLSLEKIHHEEMKATGERSESLGDLLDRVRSSSEFSSSYEQLDSDSTLKASDSLDRHIGSSSSNVRLNASSRGSLTTSSRGSLATSSRGSLNASSRGSLQGSSGPDEEEERKTKKLSFFRYARRSSVPDASKDTPSAEVRSTTLPRSTPAQILTTGTLPRSQSSQGPPSRSPSTLLSSHSTSTDRPPVYPAGGPRSARYHAPGYRPPPAALPQKRTFSSTTLRKERLWPSSEECSPCAEDMSPSSGVAGHPGGVVSSGRAATLPSPLGRMGGSSSTLGSSLASSLGRTPGNDSFAGSTTSFDNSPPDEHDPKRADSDGGGRSPLAALGPKSRSESLASVYSSVGEGRFGAVCVQGEVRVAFQYNYKENQLECHIIQARDLASVDTKRNRTDPYVKAYLLPDKSKSGKRKTKVKRHTLNPLFDEIFKFGTTLNEMESRTLWISVWHSDMFGRNVFLGEVLIPLSDALFEDSIPRWCSLVDRNEPMEDLNYGAVLIVALKFVPPDVLVLGGSGGSARKSKRSRGALQVRIKEASSLVAAKSQNPPDPICKGVLMPEKGKASKQKTNTIRKTSSPKWNHTMTFDDVTLQELTERSLELSIFNHDRFGSSEFLGGCRLNLGRGQHKNRIVEWLDASGLEQKLWEQMLDRPNLWVESSILLRPNIERPIYSSAFTD